MRKISIPSNLFLLFLLVLLIIPPGCERILGYLKSRMDEDFKRRSEKRYEKISGYPKTAVSSYGEDVGTITIQEGTKFIEIYLPTTREKISKGKKISRRKIILRPGDKYFHELREEGEKVILAYTTIAKRVVGPNFIESAYQKGCTVVVFNYEKPIKLLRYPNEKKAVGYCRQAIFIPEGPSVTPASKKVFYLSSDPDKESGCFGTDRDLSPMLKIVEKSLLPNKLRVVEKLSRTHWRYPLNF